MQLATIPTDRIPVFVTWAIQEVERAVQVLCIRLFKQMKSFVLFRIQQKLVYCSKWCARFCMFVSLHIWTVRSRNGRTDGRNDLWMIAWTGWMIGQAGGRTDERTYTDLWIPGWMD